jgi:hypothetical protein
MDPVLEKVKDIYAEGCVSIILNTNRTKPENEKDSIILKNLIKEAEERLYKTYDKRVVWSIMENLNSIVNKIRHEENIESLLIFANKDFSDFTRLPVKVQNRVIIDNSFATRDFIRALHQESGYYVLVISRQQARLIEAFNDKLINEFADVFPVYNDLYTTSKAKLSTNKGQDNLIEEFFNRIDKIVIDITKNNPQPIVIATEKRNYDHYIKIADKPDLIIGNINRNRDKDKASNIVKDAWLEVLDLLKTKNKDRLNELGKAIGENKVFFDLVDIWEAVKQGRGKTLFVRKGYFQHAIIEGNKLIFNTELTSNSNNVMIDDIVDEIIEKNLEYGGDTVFIEKSENTELFSNIALTIRY